MDTELTYPLDADQYQLSAHARHASFEVRDADRGRQPTHICQCGICGGVFLGAAKCPQCGAIDVVDATNYESESERRSREIYNNMMWHAQERTRRLRERQQRLRLGVARCRSPQRARSRRTRTIRSAAKPSISADDSSSSEPPSRRAPQLGGVA